MSKIEDVRVPDIGDFKDVEIIEVSVKAGDSVGADSPLITLESDKATMEVPSPISGVVKEVKVKVGDKVSQGSLILSMEVAGEEREAAEVAAPPPSKEKIRQGAAPAPEAGTGATSYGGRSGLYDLIEVRVPDIGNFKDVPIIEVAVEEGDRIAADAPLITLESDKASIEVPSPAAGVVKEMAVAVGDKVSEGSLILKLQTAEAAAKPPAPAPKSSAYAGGEGRRPRRGRRARRRTRRLHGRVSRRRPRKDDVVLIERYAALGGVCLNVGCIPSKALLHVAHGDPRRRGKRPIRHPLRAAGNRCWTSCRTGRAVSSRP